MTLKYSDESGEFAQVWSAAFGESPPLGYVLRHFHHKQWTRLHALLDSKRFAETQLEQQTILSRANILIEECFEDASALWIVAPVWDDSPKSTQNLVSRLKMSQVCSWANPADELEDQIRTNFYAAKMVFQQHSLDWLLSDIAEEEVQALMFSNLDGTILAPYAGGFDIICPDPSKILRLEKKYELWMSKRQDKL